MRRASLFFVVIMISQIVMSVPSHAIETVIIESATIESIEVIKPATAPNILPVTLDAPKPLPVGDMLITSYRVMGGQLNYVELYNKSSDIVDLSNWRVIVRVMSDGQMLPIDQRLTGFAMPHTHVMIARDGATTERDVALTLPSDLPTLTQLTLEIPGSYSTPTKSMSFVDGASYTLRQTSTGYTTTNEFVTGNSANYGGLYIPPAETTLRVREIFANVRSCGPNEDAPDCREFVKICNVGDQTAALDAYRLRLGAANVNAGLTNAIPLHGALPAGECRAIDARSDGDWLDVPSSGHAWIEDAYGVKNYVATDVVYTDINVSAHDGHSWAYDDVDATWKWALPTLIGPNHDFIISDLLNNEAAVAACRDGQYRSVETGRCRNTVSTEGVKTPCKDGQYRSEETGRCRSIAAAASVAKACAEDQFRNPETGRCKQIASTDDLAACKPGQERNPDTNRCRNVSVSNMPKADFAVQPVASTTHTFGAWWALGGLGLVAVTYGAWEWRHELRAGLARLRSNFASRVK